MLVFVAVVDAMKKSQIIMLAGGLAVCLCSVPLLGAEEGSEQDLPGYYEFFAKTGKLTRLDSEVKRDEAVKAGKIVPVPMNQPLPDLRLPDGFGKVHGTRDSVGKKNRVLVTGRAWW